jgi:hypothetical protein
MNARVALCLALLFAAGPGFAQSPQAARKGQLLLPEFPTLAEKASETVNVSFGPELLGLAARFLNSSDPEQAAAKKIAESLTGVYVRSFTFESDFAYPKADIDRIRRQLSAPGWTRMVEARSKKESTDVDVFVLIDNGKAMGLAIIASEPREFTIVNIVGAIDLEQLHKLEGSFGVPELGIETPQKK